MAAKKEYEFCIIWDAPAQYEFAGEKVQCVHMQYSLKMNEKPNSNYIMRTENWNSQRFWKSSNVLFDNLNEEEIEFIC